MKITLFGASGATGRQIIDQACGAGHDVTAVVRDPSRIPDVHPGLTVVQANVMDPVEIAPVIAGHDAVVSTLGSRDGRAPTTICADGASSIVQAMKAAGVRRLVSVSASGMFTDGDDLFTRLVAKRILGAVLKHPFADMRRMEEVVRASGLDWTIVRPPMLTDGRRTGSYRSAVDRNVRGGIRVSRADLSDCILRCLRDNAPVNAAIAIGN